MYSGRRHGTRGMSLSSFRPRGRGLGRHCLRNGRRQTLASSGLLTELAPAAGGQGVVLGSAVVLGDYPLRLDPAFPGHAVERWVEGAFLDGERVVGDRLDPAGDSIPMHGPPREGLEHEQFDRPLEQTGVFIEHEASEMSVRETAGPAERFTYAGLGKLARCTLDAQ